MKIAGSFLKIQNEIEKIIELDSIADQIHYDVMDGKFVSNTTVDICKMQEISKHITKPKDVHLMVYDIKKYVREYSKLKPDYITFHYEATNNINEIINYIKLLNIKVGIAINPDTDVSLLMPYLDVVDLVLVMSVFPGKGGQTFIDVSSKIDYLYSLKYVIEVDGGINNETIKKVNKVDIAVVGSYITDSDDYRTQVEKVRDSYE
ncbi:MAG: ribulose-phosphate 3-epimerase [Alphaproteobacteria bacterium]|nr:ribulose-phosphate 3-epimerase [Alphaproteobacteria bacterium]